MVKILNKIKVKMSGKFYLSDLNFTFDRSKPGWRNWQTHHFEGVARKRASSSLVSGTKKRLQL